MTRIFGHFVSLEMFNLWLVEFPLSILVFYGIFSLGTRDVGFLIASGDQVLGPAIIAAIVTNLTSAAVGLYKPEACFEIRRFFASLVMASALGFGALLCASLVMPTYFPVYLRSLSTDGQTLFVDVFAVFSIWLSTLILVRVGFGQLIQSGLFRRSILILGGQPEWLGNQRLEPLSRGASFRIERFAPTVREREVVPEELLKQKIWGIVIGPEVRKSLDPATLIRCKALGIRIFNEIEFRESYLQRVDIDNLCPEWLAYAQGFSASRLSSVTRRGVDVLVATLLLIATAPLMLVAALAIKFDSRGPLFYLQERVGLFGRPFMLMKFRSMQANAEKDSGPRWATKSDPRVTRIGALLRLTRIDELPQLFNVLKGDMSLIGPRPERPYFVERLTEAIPRYADRSYVKPGVTGWAQVNFSYGASIEDSRMKLSYDLYYVKHRSFFLDLLILFSTVRVILFQEGAR